MAIWSGLITASLNCDTRRLVGRRRKMEAAAGLEPTKTGFADQRLDHFGIATTSPSVKTTHFIDRMWSERWTGRTFRRWSKWRGPTTNS